MGHITFHKPCLMRNLLIKKPNKAVPNTVQGEMHQST